MSNHPQSPKILVILGPTASGKSALAVKLAKRYDGEVISADSRQVYRGLDIGTAKVNGKWRIVNGKRIFIYRNVRHHLIDFVNPKRQYSPAEFAAAGQKILQSLVTNHSLPIICGGSGQYIDALLGVHPIPEVPPDMKLRAKLEKLSVAELFAKLRKLDPRRAKIIDRHNPRRLIRALEIVMKTGKPVPKSTNLQHPYNLKFVRMLSGKVLKIGLNPRPEELRRRIKARLAKDIRRGLIAEVKKLHEQGLPAGRSFSGGLSWKRLNELGLEYRFVAQYLRGEVRTKEELSQKLQTELWRYTKQQMRWFRRDTSIRWVKDEYTAIKIAQQFQKSVS